MLRVFLLYSNVLEICSWQLRLLTIYLAIERVVDTCGGHCGVAFANKRGRRHREWLDDITEWNGQKGLEEFGEDGS